VPRASRYGVRPSAAGPPGGGGRGLPPPHRAPLAGRPPPQPPLDSPAYTDLPPRDLPDGSGSIDCVTGTLVRIRAATDRPIAHAWVELAADPPRPAVAAGLLALAAATPAEALGAAAAGPALTGRVPAAVPRH